MKIAVTYNTEDGTVAAGLGTATAIKFYDTEGQEITGAEVEEMSAPGHGSIAVTVFGRGVDVIMCGGIRPSAMGGLEMSGMKVIAGVHGDADTAVKLYLAGMLEHDPEAVNPSEACGHAGEHDHDHDHVMH